MREASRIMVGLLALAHDRGVEGEIAATLDALLDAGELPDLVSIHASGDFGASGADRAAASKRLRPIVERLLPGDRSMTLTTDTARLPLLLTTLRLPTIIQDVFKYPIYQN